MLMKEHVVYSSLGILLRRSVIGPSLRSPSVLSCCVWAVIRSTVIGKLVVDVVDVVDVWLVILAAGSFPPIVILTS